ncbi:hypothetical protein MNBD_GAMMA16-1439 [hydrothermal vent metagenome]|uniref:EF-hand domain-containing protein n=1 Tax=hydrothermal vent metagenome TaxID=652676 RepID=A0A3B0Z7T6_9ZZZZ
MKIKIILAMVLGFAVSGYSFAADPAASIDEQFTALDADQSGSLSPEEVRNLQGIGDKFSELDTDGSGTLQPSELAAAMAPAP